MKSKILDLPEDIIFDIFSRLSIKTLLQCRSVSKHWSTLINNADFINVHLKNSMRTCPKIILNSDSSSKFSSIEIDKMVPNFLTIDHKCSHEHQYSIVGSCNGLLCLSELSTYISLWNPSLYEYFTLPYDTIDPRSPVNKTTTVVGFGYSPTTNEYKVVRFVHFFSFQKQFHLSEVKVYTLGMHNKAQWRFVKVEEPFVFQNPNDVVVHLNGVLYWLNSNRRRSNNEETKVVCFDLGCEKFYTLPIPDGMFGTDELKLGLLQGCLSFFRRSGFECVDIWLMENSCWTPLFTVNLPRSLQARAVLINYTFEPIELRKNGELIVKCGKRDLIVYNPTTKTYRYPILRGIRFWSTSFTYVEALTTLTSLTGRPCKEQKPANKAWELLSYIFNFNSSTCIVPSINNDIF